MKISLIEFITLKITYNQSNTTCNITQNSKDMLVNLSNYYEQNLFNKVFRD